MDESERPSHRVRWRLEDRRVEGGVQGRIFAAAKADRGAPEHVRRNILARPWGSRGSAEYSPWGDRGHPRQKYRAKTKNLRTTTNPHQNRNSLNENEEVEPPGSEEKTEPPGSEEKTEPPGSKKAEAPASTITHRTGRRSSAGCWCRRTPARRSPAAPGCRSRCPCRARSARSRCPQGTGRRTGSRSLRRG